MRAGEKAQPLVEAGADMMVLPLAEAGTNMTTCDAGPAVTMVTGGSTEAIASDCKQLFRSLSSCSRTLMQLCSLVSAASALQ